MDNKEEKTGRNKFPKGNQFWKLRSEHGRKKIFETPKALLRAAVKYFEWCDENPFYEEDFIRGGEKAGTIVKMKRKRPYTLHGLSCFLDVNSNYLNEFEKRLIEEKHPELSDFSKVITRIRDIIYDNKFSGAAAGFFNANIIARDLGLADKSKVEVQTEQPLFGDPEENEEDKEG